MSLRSPVSYPSKGHYYVQSCMLAKGGAKDSRGYTEEDYRFVELFKDLMDAAGMDDYERCKELVPQVRDISARFIYMGLGNDSRHWNTPLHQAAKAGSRRVFKLLVEHGANRLITNAEGKTAEDLFPTPDRSHSFHRGAVAPPGGLLGLPAAPLSLSQASQAPTSLPRAGEHDKGAGVTSSSGSAELIITSATPAPGQGEPNSYGDSDFDDGLFIFEE